MGQSHSPNGAHSGSEHTGRMLDWARQTVLVVPTRTWRLSQGASTRAKAHLLLIITLMHRSKCLQVLCALATFKGTGKR